jgi:hypothetical protein
LLDNLDGNGEKKKEDKGDAPPKESHHDEEDSPSASSRKSYVWLHPPPLVELSKIDMLFVLQDARDKDDIDKMKQGEHQSENNNLKNEEAKN